MNKKITALLIILLISFSSCNTLKIQRAQINSVMNRVYIGMPIKEFNTIFKPEDIQLVYLEKEVAIYKGYIFTIQGENSNYFYFRDNKLFKVNKEVNPLWSQMNDIMNRVYIGMSIKEFNIIFKPTEIELVSSENEITIYKGYLHSQLGEDFNYFYFRNNKLFKVNKTIKN